MRLIQILILVLALAGKAGGEQTSPTLQESRQWLVEKKFLKDGSDLEKQSTLKLVGASLSDEDLRFLIPLCDLKNLKGLDLRNNDLHGPGFERLKRECPRFESVTTLDLAENKNLTDKALAHLTLFPNLREVNLDDNLLITGVGFTGLSPSLAKLEKLWLVRCPLSNEGLDAIAAIESVRDLVLVETKIGNEAVKRFSRNLMSLNLKKTQFDDEGLALLAGRLSLRSLLIGDTRVTYEGVRASIARMNDLTELDLSGLKMGKHVADLAELLSKGKIETLHLKMSGLTWELLAPMAKLASLKKLHVYDLDFEVGENKNILPAKNDKQFHDYRNSLKFKPVELTW